MAYLGIPSNLVVLQQRHVGGGAVIENRLKSYGYMSGYKRPRMFCISEFVSFGAIRTYKIFFSKVRLDFW